MLVCVVGTSTSLTYWGFALAAHAMEEAYGAFHRVHCTSLAEMREQVSARGDRRVLFTTDLLDGKISDLIRESGAPLVALADTAEVAMLTAAQLRKLPFLPAVRLSSLYLSSLAEILLDPATRV